jgi:hypothetical protein
MVAGARRCRRQWSIAPSSMACMSAFCVRAAVHLAHLIGGTATSILVLQYYCRRTGVLAAFFACFGVVYTISYVNRQCGLWVVGNEYPDVIHLRNVRRWIIDSRDQATEQRLKEIDDTYKLYRCHTIMNCATVCPKVCLAPSCPAVCAGMLVVNTTCSCIAACL